MKLQAGQGSPSAHHLILRPRLTRLLDETSAQVILLVAPAGYGKTTLAREWLKERTHAWYRGDSATGDVAALAVGLARAFSAIIPSAGDRIRARLRISRAPNEEVDRLAEMLAEDLQDWPRDAWVAFDDYQFACDSQPAERFVQHLVSQCGVQLLVASRSRPKWATARRMIYGEILEIGRNLLAMTQDEALETLRTRSPNEAEELLFIADGWPALIGLAAVASSIDMPGQVVPDELYAFFAEELYTAASPSMQRTLRRLALAPYVTREIATIIVDEEPDNILTKGVELGFLAPTGHQRFEFHPLLGLFLASKFEPRIDDPTGAVVNDLASILIRLNEWDAMFALASRFGDGNLLVSLLEASLGQMLEQARLPTLARWLDTARSHGLDSPLIDLADAELAFRRGELQRAEAVACQAARRLGAGHPSKSRALWIAGTSAHLAYQDETSLEYFKAAAATSVSETDEEQALWGQFIATESLEHKEEAASLLTRLIEISDNTVDQLLRIATGHFRMAQLSGSIGRALEEHKALPHLTDRARDPLIRSSFLNSYVALIVISGDYERALDESQAEIRFLIESGLDFALPHAQLLVAASQLGLRKFRDCKASLKACEAKTLENDFVACNLRVLHGRLRLAMHQLEEAANVFEEGQVLAKSCRAMHPEYLAWWSFVQAVAGRHAEAADLATRAETLSQRIEVSAVVPWTRAVLAARKTSKPKAEVMAAWDVMRERVVTSTLSSRHIGHVLGFFPSSRVIPNARGRLRTSSSAPVITLSAFQWVWQ